MALTLDNIRQLYNLQKASDKEVMEFAKANNIEISLSGVKNTANLKDLKGNVGGSVFGFNNHQVSQQKKSTSFTPQSRLTFGNSENYDIAKNIKLSSTGSIFSGFGNAKTTGLDTTFNQNVSSNVAQSGVNSDMKKTSILDDFLSNAMLNFRTSKKTEITYVDGSAEVDMSKVKSQEFMDGGKLRYTMEDGSVVEKQLSEETIQKIGAKAQYSKIEYVDGKAVYYDLNGNEIKDKTRDARFGERGYVKDGNSIDEDLVSVLGQSKLEKLATKKVKAQKTLAQINERLTEFSDEKIAQVAQTDPEKAKEMKKEQEKYQRRRDIVNSSMNNKYEAIASDYIKSVYKECDGDPQKIKARISNLIKNSDMNTEAAQQMVHILGAFVEKTKNMSKEEIATFFETAMDASVSGAADNASAMADPITRMNGKKGKVMLDAYATAAQNTGNAKIVRDALLENSTNTINPETNEVNKEQNTNISRTYIALGGRVSELAENAVNVDNDDYKLSTNVAIDEHAAKTGDKEVMSASLDVAQSIKDAKKQAEANESAHKIYDEMGASDKTKQARAEMVGSRIGGFHEDAQLDIDSTERKYDIDDVYNLAVSQVIQTMASKNQQEMVQRTINSGNEDAMTNVANHAYELDPDNVEDVVKMLKEQGSDKTKQALEEAKVKYEEQAKRDKEIAEAKKAEAERAKVAQAEAEKAKAKVKEQQAKTQTQQPAKNTQSIAQGNTQHVKSGIALSNVSILKAISSKEFKEKSIAEKKEVFKQLNTRERAQAIGEMVESSEATSLKNMMFSSFKTEILKYLVQHANAQNTQKLKYVERFLSPTDKKLLEKMQDEHAKNNVIL